MSLVAKQLFLCIQFFGPHWPLPVLEVNTILHTCECETVLFFDVSSVMHSLLGHTLVS